ncbi:glutathione S-transferase domain-containing protein [Burkholderia lata]|uniref:Glutathione S-transferase domain-containing protein n=1 Tax=Burkholderia lata (strain ATCC 17760 / DSM 23089 / LMG 22485 / NCIMB 9086 / R18194 / 383) TaxID=482957 RepID=A0A6P2KX69_BURL3|nr:glutathione S-transferase family protein [Burkholderia lata]VWB60588.1 glutathione S-transferase domain-containing protein [Burkholderia lata]
MKLVGPWLSGYTRRVGITLNLLNIAFEHLPYHAYLQPERVAAYSPMKRVPALQLDDGQVLIDSAAIVDYLDSLVAPARRLLPEAGPERVQAMQFVGYASACYDKLARYCDELMLRPEAYRLAHLLTGYREQMKIGFDVLDSVSARPWLLGERVSQADVMTVIAFQGAATVMPDMVNGDAFPRLAALAQHAMQSTAFSSTLPDLNDLKASGLVGTGAG